MTFRRRNVTFIKCKWKRLWTDIYIGIEGVKHNYIKFEEQKNEIIKWKVLLERSRFECLRIASFP